jgi:hypothetical protein
MGNRASLSSVGRRRDRRTYGGNVDDAPTGSTQAPGGGVGGMNPLVEIVLVAGLVAALFFGMSWLNRYSRQTGASMFASAQKHLHDQQAHHGGAAPQQHQQNAQTLAAELE